MKKIWILILLLIIGGVGFIYFSPIFEKEPPKISIKTTGYTNLKNPIKIVLKDNRGIKYYQVVAIYNNNSQVLATSDDVGGKKEVVFEVKLPKNINANEVILSVSAVDTSKWHFFAGNEAKKSVKLEVDKLAPDAQVVNNSYAIGRGGSGAVVVQVNDKNLEETIASLKGVTVKNDKPAPTKAPKEEEKDFASVATATTKE